MTTDGTDIKDKATDAPLTYDVKVDGKEMKVSLDELIKGYQSGRSLTQRGQAVAEERKRLEAIKGEIASIRQDMRDMKGKRDADNVYPFTSVDSDAGDGRLTKEIETLQRNQQALMDMFKPLMRREALSQCREFVKTKYGEDDFHTYLPEIENYLLTLSPDEQAAANTSQGLLGIYAGLKLEAVKTKGDRSKPKSPPEATVMDGGGGSGDNYDHDKFNAAFKKALDTGRMDDFADVIKQIPMMTGPPAKT